MQVPVAILGHPGGVMAIPVSMPRLSVIDDDVDAAIRSVRERVVQEAKSFRGDAWLSAAMPATIEHRSIAVHFEPPAPVGGAAQVRQVDWVEPMQVPLDVLIWPLTERLFMAAIPVLRTQTIIETKVIESVDQPDNPFDAMRRTIVDHVRMTVNAGGEWNLASLWRIGQFRLEDVRTEIIPVPVATTMQYHRDQNSDVGSGNASLEKVADRLTPRNARRSTRRNARPSTPMVERDDVIGRIDAVLNPPMHGGSRCRSVLLVGPPDVGKTACFGEWVDRQRGDEVSVWSTDGARLISGQGGFGGWQERCLEIVKAAAASNMVLHLGDALVLSESGRSWGGSGVATLLSPAIAEGRVRVVMETTTEALATLRRTEPRLLESVVMVEVPPTTSQQTQRILQHAAKSHRDHAGVILAPGAAKTIERLHRRYPTASALPGRAVRFLDTVASSCVAEARQTAVRGGASANAPVGELAISVAKVRTHFATQTGLPPFLVDEDCRPDLDGIERELSDAVLGQPDAIDHLVDVISVVTTELTRRDRPLASMLLIGPTGVGKTETAKALSRLFYSDASRMIRIDMGEYGDRVSARRLIGDSMVPEGVLTGAVQSQPFSLLLLDEFEKADDSVFDLLLQVLGEGRLTDGRGRVADFRNAIIVMTSNLGVEDYREMPLGLNRDAGAEAGRMADHFLRRVSEFLRPEMLNRIDRIVPYGPLDREVIGRLVRRYVQQLMHRTGDAFADWTITDAALDEIVREGYQPQYGARQLVRTVDRHLTSELARLVSEPKEANRRVVIDVTRTADRKPPIAVTTEAFGSDPHFDGESSDAESSDAQQSAIVSLRLLQHAVGILREQSQSMMHCDVVRQMTMRYQMLSRRIARLEKRGRTPRSNVGFNSTLHSQWSSLSTQIEAARSMHERILALEADIVDAVVTDPQSIPDETGVVRFRERYDGLRGQFIELVAGLSPNAKPRDADTFNMLIAFENRHAAGILINAYLRWAISHEVQWMFAAVVPRDHRRDRELTLNLSGGWSDDVAWRWHSSGHQTHHRAAEFAGYAWTDTRLPTQLPERAVGVTIRFSGRHVRRYMAGESGLHTVMGGEFEKTTRCVVVALPEDHRKYEPPESWVSGPFPAIGEARRAFDFDRSIVRDFALSDARSGSSGHLGLSNAIPPEVQSIVRGAVDGPAEWLTPWLDWQYHRQIMRIIESDWPFGFGGRGSR